MPETIADPPPYVPPKNGWRTFLIVWVTQSISVLGSALTFFSITIWLTQVMYPNPEQKTQLAFALSATELAWALTYIIMMPIAGAWVDRHDRKEIMLIMNYISGCLTLLMMVLILTNHLTLWSLLILYMLLSTTKAFHFSAFDASYAMIVPEERLPQANGMMQTTWSLSTILSPAIAASLIALPALARQGVIEGPLGRVLQEMTNGTPIAIAIDALTFFVAFVALLFVLIPSPLKAALATKAQGTEKSIWSDIQLGFRYIWYRRPMLWLLSIFSVGTLVTGAFQVLQPMLVRFTLQADWSTKGYTLETALALLYSTSSIGGVLGGIFISTWGGLKVRRVYGALLPLIVASAALVFYGLSSWLFFAAVAGALFSSMVPIMNSHSQSIWQTQVPRELQGRVFSVRRVIQQVGYPLGMLIAGPMGGFFNPGLALAVMGAILVLFCFSQLFNTSLLRVEDKAFLDGLAAAQEAVQR